MEQLSLYSNEVVLKNQQLVHVIDGAFQSILELAIPTEMPAETRIHRLVAGAHEAREELTKVQRELNL